MHLTPHHSPAANVTATPDGWRLEIPAGDASAFRLAQLDDYAGLPRRLYPARPPVTIQLRARASSQSIPGTWGFGLWNDPFGMSLGFGGGKFRLPALPNAAWFFHASEENYLSFKSPRRESESAAFGNNPEEELRDSKTTPANGFLAQAFRAPIFDIRLFLAGLTLPFSRKAARRWLGRIVREHGVRLGVDPAEWRLYRLEWSPARVVCEVDGVRVLETSVSPRPPLGLVIWIDNQFAAFTPAGKIGFGVLPAPEPAWIEIADLRLNDTLTV